MWLTQQGRAALGVEEKETDRRGGPVHAYWVDRIAEELRANGYEVQKERPIGGGKSIDVVATRDGKRIAFEIETGSSDAAANVRKCLDASMDRVLVVAPSEMAQKRIEVGLPHDQRVSCIAAAHAIRVASSPIGWPYAP